MAVLQVHSSLFRLPLGNIQLHPPNAQRSNPFGRGVEAAPGFELALEGLGRLGFGARVNQCVDGGAFGPELDFLNSAGFNQCPQDLLVHCGTALAVFKPLNMVQMRYICNTRVLRWLRPKQPP